MTGVIIKDELYGTIQLTEIERAVVDTADFQRLRRIKQMVLTNLVYPGANHTRFEHSLGTMHLASMITERLNIEKERKDRIRLYALLHDVGHVAFSHESERVLSNIIGSHEEVGRKKITEGEIGDVLREHYDPRNIADLGNGADGKIVDSDLGADRMDYLMRDAQNTGVAYGMIDSDRIIHTLRMADGELVIEEGGLAAAESLLIARFMMFSVVYFHHTVRVAGAMLGLAIKKALDSDELTSNDFLDAGDEELFLKLKKIPSSSSLANRLLKRRLLKVACSLEPTEKLRKKINEFERTLSETVKCEIIIDWPHEFFKPIDCVVRTSEGLKKITELSELVRSLKNSEERRRRVLVLCPNEFRERVAEEVAELIKSE